MTIVKGVKGFDKNLKCRDFQYEIGREYESDKKPVRCTENGFHFCENPLDVFTYYPPTENRFCEVDGSGQISKDESSDTKVAVSKIKIGGEIDLHRLTDLAVKFIFEKIKWEDKKESNTGDRSAATNTRYQSAATNTGYRSAATNTGYQSAATNTGYQSAATNTGGRSAATNTGDRSAATNTGDRSAATNTGDRSAATNTGYQSAATNTGYQSAATNTGYQSAATNTGDRSAATNTGDRSAAEVSGKESIACALGINCMAKGSIGCWLVIAERNDMGAILTVKSVKVDGKKIKENTFYTVQGGKVIESSKIK